MTRCPIPILQTSPREVAPVAAGTQRGSPSRRAVARLSQSPPEHPTWALRLQAHGLNRGAMGLPADSAALFQAWSGLRVAEDCGSFCAEKPQITLATGPDKTSVGGSLPDKPRCSHQPQGPRQSKPVSRGQLLPGISALLLQRPGNRLADPSQKFLRPLGPKEEQTNTLIYFQEENVKECASLSGIPDCGSWGVGAGGWLEYLTRAPQMTSPVASFMSREPTLPGIRVGTGDTETNET